MDKVYIIITVVNGYKNIFGHHVYNDYDNAVEAAKYAECCGYDEVYVTEWKVC